MTTPSTPQTLPEPTVEDLQRELLAICKALALAIGWQSEQIQTDAQGVYCCAAVATLFSFSAWKKFDYRDPVVIWPIAERFDCFPRKSAEPDWWTVWDGTRYYDANTPAKAAALAVIGGLPSAAQGAQEGGIK